MIGRWSYPSLEGSGYLYVDRRGRFGIFEYHQDGYDLGPMLGDSPAHMTWDDLMGAALTRVLEGEDYD